MKKLANSCLTSVIVVVVILVAFFVIVLNIAKDDNNSDSPATSNTGSGVVETIAENNNSVLYEDDNFVVEYIKVYDVPGMDYPAYLQLKITNKSSQTVQLLLKDVYVNDINVQSGTAMPIKLEPEKISQSPFILFTAPTELKLGDISKIEFVLHGLDDNFNELYATDKIIIEK